MQPARMLTPQTPELSFQPVFFSFIYLYLELREPRPTWYQQRTDKKFLPGLSLFWALLKHPVSTHFVQVKRTSICIVRNS